jgi:lysophospholipid acyltransferase (LPLAT)-like uncharacterized protein
MRNCCRSSGTGVASAWGGRERITDGEYAAQVAEGFGYRHSGLEQSTGGQGAAGGRARTAGGHQRHLHPDGPRGPRGSSSPGRPWRPACGVPLVPIRATPLKAWRLRSWDQFAIPQARAHGCGSPMATRSSGARFGGYFRGAPGG